MLHTKEAKSIYSQQIESINLPRERRLKVETSTCHILQLQEQKIANFSFELYPLWRKKNHVNYSTRSKVLNRDFADPTFATPTPHFQRATTMPIVL
jgi:hypothetical protein